MVGTPYSEVHRSCGHRLQGRRRVEARRRDDHRGAVGGAGQVAHHHAEAVVERHRDAHPVPLPCSRTSCADEVAVVEDVVVRQRRALGEAGRPGGVLDVDRVVRPTARPARRPASPCHARRPTASRSSHASEPISTTERSWRAVRSDLLDHARVVGGLELPAPTTSMRDAGLVEHVLELVRAVAGVDVDQDGADLRGRVLQQRPLGQFGAQIPTRSPLPTPARQQTERERRRRPHAAVRRSSAGRSGPRPGPRGPGRPRPSGRSCRRWCRRATAGRKWRKRRTARRGCGGCRSR